MFDWANSSYNLVITSTIFPAYYGAITITKEHGDKVFFFGKRFVNTALETYTLAIAYLIIALLSPLLSSTADYRGNKKIFMQLFTWLGALACIGLFWFELKTLELGIICFGLAAIGYCGALVFYNSYLPEIATVDKQDAVSAQGYAYGYVGSVILQVICFVFVLAPKTFGMTDTFAVQLSFLLTGVWWIGFAMIPFLILPKGSPNFIRQKGEKVRNGFQELQKVFSQVKKMGSTKRFLLGFFFYSMGVQTVMLVAAAFGEKVLKLPATNLIATILIIQLVAIFGALLMSKLSARFGNIRVLIGVVMIWIGVCFAAYFLANVIQFYIIAAVVGLVMGGIQSLSRSTYSKFIPAETADSTSFFSFYDICEKVAIVAGLFTFGFIEEFTGSMRNSVIALALFFVIGLICLVSLLYYEQNRHTDFAVEMPA